MKKNQKINFDLEKSLLNEKVAKTPKSDPFLVKSAKKNMFGGTFDPKTPIFNVFSDFAGDGPISWSHPDPIQKPERVKIGSKIMSTTIWEKSESFMPFAQLVMEL